jgi:hypothetical protein
MEYTLIKMITFSFSLCYSDTQLAQIGFVNMVVYLFECVVNDGVSVSQQNRAWPKNNSTRTLRRPKRPKKNTAVHARLFSHFD